ncbi:TPA: AbrB/MazE/SpoVT family DNA-binding domain-containing protein [Klebsiella aerogenes]|nr:AbrB/MazE/SpoVT family DNA-binding domain-containing protein [Klebsiella aerogenes]HDU4054858.1 AbrB/MazE/SpoVT family DNA-binding domain-containing protein [Klebsiella aerogenes]
MKKITVSKNNGSQLVRLSKAVVFPEYIKYVDIVVAGRTRIIIPAGESWDSWFDGESVTSDFMMTRE